jgi:outer membrane protein OmpA-like peptidoglycan-associated protein
MGKLKTLPKAIIGLIVIGGVAFGVNTAINKGYFKQKTEVAVQVPDKIDGLGGGITSTAPKPTATTAINVMAATTGETLRVKTIPWNGTLGLMHAQASGAFRAHNLNVDIKREDDYSKMIADMAAFAKDPTQGVHFTVIMGDGLPAYIIGLNEALKPFGQQAEMIAGIGYSRGEDKCVIADEANPRGALIAGVLGDGDINICIKYAADNAIPINANPKTYDPDAMNFMGTGSFVEADEKFISSARNNYKGGACEERKNTKTGDKQTVCVTGSATWTPGDVKDFSELKKLGKSLRVIGSTKEYAWQMPAAIIGNKTWMANNRPTVEAFLASILESGEKVRGDNQALMVASAEQAKVIGEQDASYWAEMFKGTTDVSPNGKTIQLGGSTTNGLSDAAFMFGLNGADDLYSKVYNVYGKISVKYFPDLMPGGLRPYGDVVNKSFIQALLAKATNVAQVDKPVYSSTTTETFAAKSYAIEFETGKATFSPSAVKVLNDLLDQAAVTTLNVQINGHTDNTGDSGTNIGLSKDRAEAVKNFLMKNAPSTFTAERVQTRGYGDTQPIADNNTVAGKAKNRRVEVILRK